MAYDAARGQVVLFGGENSLGLLADTWVWNGATWTPKSPTHSPPPRYSHVMAYDAAHGQTVLFGGLDSNNFILPDMWVWDGTDWTNVTPAPPAPYPPARYSSSMAYDAAHGQVVLFGGESNLGVLADMWVWNGGSWTNETPAPNPPARYYAAMAYDAERGQVALFGGIGEPGDLPDMWLWAHGIFATAGNPQSTPAGSAFSFPLEVTVVDNNGNYLARSSVTFSAPPGMISSFSPSATVSTDANGRASVTATASSTAGAYAVTASLASGDFATFSLSNVNPNAFSGACPVSTALDDNSSGSLRSQIATCGLGGTVTFAPGTSRVALFEGQDIQLTQNLTINGGAGTAIDASRSSRIFFVNGGNDALENLTLENGSAVGGDGSNTIQPGVGGAAGGAAAGMGGAIFLNAGNLSITNATLSSNQAQGGSGGIAGIGQATLGGGAGMGGDNMGLFVGVCCGNGGGGGDLGGSGSDASAVPAGTGGMGSGGGYGEVGGFGGFGGGGGAGKLIGGAGGFGSGGGGGNAHGGGTGGFGGGGGDFYGGGGAGFGGAIFAYSGSLNLSSVVFSNNSATGGSGNGDGGNGQGKGGALFIYSGVTALYSGVTFSGSTAPDAGAAGVGNSPAPYTNGSKCPGQDNADICGALNPAPFLSVFKTPNGTFTQGQAAEWDVTVSNTPPSTTTNGTVTMQDTLPSGYTISAFTGTDTGTWTCGGTGTAAATCTTTVQLAGGSSYPVIHILVSVPANSATSVTNNALVFGGSDVNHTNSV